MSLTAQNYYADERTLKKDFRMFTLSDELLGKINKIPNVIDNLESESAEDALSANMGRVLKEMIDNLEIEVDDHLDIHSENPVQNKVIAEALTGYALLGDVNTKTFFMNGNKLPGDEYNIEVAKDVVNFMNEGGKALIEYGPQTYVANRYPVEHGERKYAFYAFNTFSLSNGSILDIDVLQFIMEAGEVVDVTKTDHSLLTIDAYLDAASNNPVANAAIVLALAGKANMAYSSVAPQNPNGGDLWFNDTTGEIKYYNGTEWTGMGGGGTTYVAGDGISINTNTDEISVNAADLPGYGLLEDGNNNLAVDPSIIATQNDLNGKQDTLTAGDHITIVNNRISAVNFQEPLVAGTNIQIDPATNVISATDTTYQAGTRITIDPVTHVISADMSGVMTYMGNVTDPNQLPASGNQGDCWYSESDGHLYAWDGTQWNDIGGTGPDLTNYFNKQTDTTDNITEGNKLFVTIAEKNIWNAKQDKIIAGNNITINADGKTINAVVPAPITYQAGSGIDITNNVITNTKQFNPGNGTAGQILRKTANGYEWSNEQGGGGGQTPNNGVLTINQGNQTWRFTADQANNTTINLESYDNEPINVSNTPYGTAWKNKKNSAPSQNAVYDAIEDVKASIEAPGAGILTLKQNTNILGTFSANEKNNKIITVPDGFKYIRQDTQLWTLTPGTYIIGAPEDEGTFTHIKLYCKLQPGRAVGQPGQEGVHYFKAYFGSELSVHYINTTDVTPEPHTDGHYYTMLAGWHIHYGYANPTIGTYRNNILHQNDPYQLGEVRGDVVIDFHESTNYSMIAKGDVNLIFGDYDLDPDTYGPTPGMAFSILIKQDSVGGHVVDFDETMQQQMRIIKASGFKHITDANSVSQLILAKQSFYKMKGTAEECAAAERQYPGQYFDSTYYLASITKYV